MKYILVVLQGAADQPCEELGGKTPLEAAKIPYLHAFAKAGKVGMARLFSERWGALPDASLLQLLGYEADKLYTGRAPLEAANLELKLESNEVPFRINLITESGGKLADHTAGHITNKESRALLNFLNKKLASDFVRFFAGAGHRHVAVIKDAHGFEALSAKTIPPQDIVGEPIDAHLPKGPGCELLKKLMSDARLLLQDHEINQVRLDLGENPANMIWFWGQGRMPQLEKFSKEYNLSGAILSDHEYARGIARLAGMTVLESGEAGEDVGAALEKKCRKAIDALEDKDFVLLHLTECDSASRDGSLRDKVSALEAADFFLFSKLKAAMDKHKDMRILVTSLYPASWQQRKRLRETAPFLFAGKNIMPDDTEKFSETAAKVSDLKLKGGELMAQFTHHSS